MTTYAFILGRKHLLSIAELCAVLPKDSHIIDVRKEALIATFPNPLSRPQDSLDRLGGTLKIAEVFAELPSKAEAANNISPLTIDAVITAVSSYLLDKFKDRETKLSYGLSVYSFAGGHEQLIKKTLMGVKKELKSAGLKTRFINNNFHNLENAAIKGEKLLEDGAEIVAIQGTHKTYLADTKALQDFENYSHRDYERPERDTKLGMLPPKLAQIMINLSGLTQLDAAVDPQKSIYDPFAGIGTIPTEALLLGYSVVASDISPEIIKKTEKNIEWMKTQTGLKHPSGSSGT
ncbi:MAG TPA: hypothetical protein VI588_02365, partial [Candidatus Gracilibacteria bacterium]|nr:hypothetical protein [Candidatus Gracilibacteria bacterium]